MALKDIVEHILAEAQTKATDLTKSAKDQAKAYEKESLEKLQERLNESEQKGKEAINEIERKMKSLLQIEERNKILTKKQQLIEQSFLKALETLSKLGDKEYEALLTSLCHQSNLADYKTGSVLVAKGRKKISEKVLSKVNDGIKVEGEGDFEGGFIFKSPVVDIDSSFGHILMRNIKPQIEHEVAQILFKKM